MNLIQLNSKNKMYGILLPKLFWHTVRKNCFSNQKSDWQLKVSTTIGPKPFWSRIEHLVFHGKVYSVKIGPIFVSSVWFSFKVSKYPLNLFTFSQKYTWFCAHELETPRPIFHNRQKNFSQIREIEKLCRFRFGRWKIAGERGHCICPTSMFCQFR